MSLSQREPGVCRRVAVVGVGARGRDWIQALVANARWQLTAAVDLDDTALARVVEAVGLDESACYKHFDEALEEADCDAAIITVPCPQRDAVFQLACDRRLHLCGRKASGLQR